MTNQQSESKEPSGWKIFEKKESKTLFSRSIRYLLIALPLLFISPIVVTIGFKAINSSQNYIMIVIGCILTVATVVLVIIGFRLLLKALFAK